MTKVAITQSKLDDLALHISAKSGEQMPLTIDEMQDAVDGILVPSGTIEIVSNGTGIDVSQYASADVAVPSGTPTLESVSKSYTPTESVQTETITYGSGYDGLSSVDITVGAISSSYVGSGITRRDSSDLSASNATVSVPSGYYAANASKAVSSGSVTAPNSISGTGATVSTGTNTLTLSKTISVTPNLTSAGYISAATAGNSDVSLTASVNTRTSSDLTASGATVIAPAGYYASQASKSVDSMTLPTSASSTGTGTNKATIGRSTSNQYINIPTGYNSANAYYTVSAVANGTAGTPTATKGTVSNHSVSVTPSVTNTTGYITGSTKTGTAVTVSASELVSGSETKTSNGTYDVTNLAELVVNVSGGGGSGLQVATATKTTNAAASSITFSNLSGEPTSFYLISASDVTTGGTRAAAIVFDGTSLHAQEVTSQATYAATGFSKSFSNGTLTVTATSAQFPAGDYKLVYTHGGTSANLGTSDVQVGSGATSITFTGLTDEPTCWSVIFKDGFTTSSGYQRVIAIQNDGTSTYGLALDSQANAESAWTASYSNGTLTISSSSTSVGGYFHQPGYYQLSYAIGGTVTIDIEPLSVTENGTYQEAGVAYSPVVVNVSGGGSVSYDTKTVTASDYPVSLQFSSMKGQPKFFVVRLNAQVSSSGSTTYYYIVDIVSDGTTTHGNCFRIGSTRRVDNITSGYSWSYSGTTLTITSSAASRSASPGAFYSGSYELMYAY